MVISVTSIKPNRNSYFSLDRVIPTLQLLSSSFLSPILLLPICLHPLKEMNSHDCSLPSHFQTRISFPIPSQAIITWNFIFLGCMEWNCNIVYEVWSFNKEYCSMYLQHITCTMELQPISFIVELQHKSCIAFICHLGTSHNIIICNKELQHKLQGRFATIFIHSNLNCT